MTFCTHPVRTRAYACPFCVLQLSATIDLLGWLAESEQRIAMADALWEEVREEWDLEITAYLFREPEERESATSPNVTIMDCDVLDTESLENRYSIQYMMMYCQVEGNVQGQSW